VANSPFVTRRPSANGEIQNGASHRFVPGMHHPARLNAVLGFKAVLPSRLAILDVEDAVAFEQIKPLFHVSFQEDKRTHKSRLEASGRHVKEAVEKVAGTSLRRNSSDNSSDSWPFLAGFWRF
jgi:hypothetical protein